MAAPLTSLWHDRVRPRLARSPSAHMLRDRFAKAATRVRRRLPTRSWWQMRPEQAVRIAYNVMLNREPDPLGFADRLERIEARTMRLEDLPFWMRSSEEGLYRVPFPGYLLG